MNMMQWCQEETKHCLQCTNTRREIHMLCCSSICHDLRMKRFSRTLHHDCFHATQKYKQMSQMTRLTTKTSLDPTRRLFEDLNQPSEARLKQALKARSIPYTNEQVSEIVKGSATRQVFQPKQKFVGKPHRRLQMPVGRLI